MNITEAVAGNVKNVARHVGAAASSVLDTRLSFFQTSGGVVDELKALNHSDEDIRILDKAKDKLSLTIKVQFKFVFQKYLLLKILSFLLFF